MPYAETERHATAVHPVDVSAPLHLTLGVEGRILPAVSRHSPQSPTGTPHLSYAVAMQTPVPLVGFPPPLGGSPTLGRLTPTGGGGSGPGSALPTRGPASGKFTRQPPKSPP